MVDIGKKHMNPDKSKILNRNSKIHFVLVAGFSSDSEETFWLRDILREKGYGVTTVSFYGPDLRTEFASLTEEECIRNLTAVIDEISRESEAVFGIGISLGGALLLEHAKNHKNLAGIASVGTPFRLKNLKLMVAAQKIIIPLIYPAWKHLQKRDRLRLSPLGAARMSVAYMQNRFLENLESVKTPLLFLHSKKDRVTDWRSLEEFLPKIGSAKKEILYFDNGNHVINYSPLIIEKTLEFFNLSEPEEKTEPLAMPAPSLENPLELQTVEVSEEKR
jgi:esterase/lipase